MDPEISLYHDEAQLANMVMENRNSEGSTQSSPGFNFSLNPRKNLTDSFNNEISSLSKDHVVTQAMESKSAAITALPATIRPPLHRNHSSRRQMGDGATISSRNKVAVYLRIRPPPAASKRNVKDDGNAATIEILDATNDPGRFPTRIRTYPPSLSNAYRVNINRQARDLSAYAKEFSFDCVMGPQTSQKTVYSAVAAPMIHDLFRQSILPAPQQQPQQGSQRSVMASSTSSSSQESALLFSYGITNAGKTHTVLGDLNSKNQSNWGIIPRAISDVFDQMKVQSASSAKGQASPQFQLYVSYFEIYNEQVYDLIPSKKTLSKHPFGEIPPLKVRECRGQTLVRGLAKHRVQNTEHGIELTKFAHNKRHTSSNNLNTDSSRSHFVCQMQIVQSTKHAAAAKMDDDDDTATVASMSGYSTDEEASSRSKQKTSTLWIVDLAGSERSKRTQVGSMRQKESTQINKSLMTLMRCLNGIQQHGRHGSASSSIIPFRESKLTHIFMSHLMSSSSARTAIMVNVNPAVADFDETQHVLAYATKAKLIEMDPEEFSRKRKQYFGEEYDINGRKKRANKASPSKRSPPKKKKTLLSRVAKKLSPKRVFQKIPGSEILSPKRAFQKTPAPAGFKSESREMLSSATAPEAMSAEVASLKAELASAKAQVQSLSDANSQLQEELETKEDQIRSEVAVEMEERLRETRQRHQAKYDMLQSQIGQETSETAFTVKMNRAETQLEELMDKVDECEKEMYRMNEDHSKEVISLQSEIAQLKEELSTAATAKQEDEAKIDALEAKVKKYKKEIKRFEQESRRTKREEKAEKEEDEENQVPKMAPPKDEEDDEGENSSTEPLNFSLNVAKKSYRRKLRPRKALKNASNKAFR